MATAFSSNDDVIERKINCQSIGATPEKIHDVYEVSRCVQWIVRNGFTRVALQFPDESLVNAPAIASHIQSEAQDSVVFILGDTSYGSCCVDEVGAQHYSADCVIHYGHACLSPVTRLPVLYVFTRSHIEVADCTTKISIACPGLGKFLLFYQTGYHYIIDEVYQRLQQTSMPPVLARLVVPGCVASPEDCDGKSSEETKVSEESSTLKTLKVCGRRIDIPIGDNIEEYSAVFIGDPNCATLVNLMMNLSKCPFYSYNPTTLSFQRETLQVNKALMKRYYLIERLKDASIVGIVAGTLGVSKYRQVMAQVKSLLKVAGKKSYTFVVGKLNPAKLANFAEVDMYVLVACPESSLIDLTEFYRPVVTPLEVDFALNSEREWTGAYSSDFRDMMPGGSMFVKAPECLDASSSADVSLISNKIRSLGTEEDVESSHMPSTELVLRSDSLAVAPIAGNASEFLANRIWQGLERNLGDTPVTKAVEGTQGIAAGYEHEPLT